MNICRFFYGAFFKCHHPKLKCTPLKCVRFDKKRCAFSIKTYQCGWDLIEQAKKIVCLVTLYARSHFVKHRMLLLSYRDRTDLLGVLQKQLLNWITSKGDIGSLQILIKSEQTTSNGFLFQLTENSENSYFFTKQRKYWQ